MLPNSFCFSSLLFIVISLSTKYSYFEVSSQTIIVNGIEQKFHGQEFINQQDSSHDSNEALDKDMVQLNCRPDPISMFDDDPDIGSRYLSAIFHANHPINRIRFHDTRKQQTTSSRSPLKNFAQKLNMLFMGPVSDTTFNIAKEHTARPVTIRPRSYGVSSTAADHSFKNRSYFVVTPANAKARAKVESAVKHFKGDY
ncbi:hypothetical protein LSTR_LSTR000003 [Laodelphax striatellus]|uniref:Receptor ligand binding region domain-containing protein n=1 Tax=Laodelphax striatellus TaxID=195883 RepID=A0A482X5X8_LAOST|nr:hypothetical protein LSTR_LSTR000003 [Laodelphax striatellus]